MHTNEQENNDFIRVENNELPLNLSINEKDMQEAATEYTKYNPDLIFPNQEDILPKEKMRFYDKLRHSVISWAEKQGAGGKYLEFILFAPDLFLLLIRLAVDERVQPQLRSMLLFVATYFISPIDAMPEAILGPVGYLDDIVLTCLAILKLVRDTDDALLQEHWGGKGDIVALINKIVNVGETLVGTSLWDSMKKRLNL
jgi:uncharacterized membrane protein YkvA (DUF1232 family)